MADEMQVNRDIVIEADAESIERLRKEGHVRGFTVFCDEQQRTGGGQLGAVSDGLLRPVGGLLTAYPSFPVRGNDEGESRQDEDLCDDALSRRGFGAA